MNRLTPSAIPVVLLAWAFAWTSAAATEEAAQTVIQDTMDSALAVLHKPNLSRQERFKEIQEIAYERFDFDRMSRLVLARNFKKLDDQQKADFREEFKRHLALTYGGALEEYTDEQIEITETRPEARGDVTVKTVIVGGKADGVTLDYRMRTRSEEWKVIDVTIEGVSLISNFRSQINEIISSKGVDQLIAQLRKRNDKREASRE